MGGSVISVTEGQKGVEKAIEEDPYLILMDIMMLRLNGREATRMLHFIPRDSRYSRPGSYASSQALGTKDMP